MIERTFDEQYIKSIAFNKEIIGDMLQDCESLEDCGIDLQNNCYLRYNDFGLFILKPVTNTVLDIHPVFLKGKRAEAIKAMYLALNWIFENCHKNLNKVIAQFPSYRKEIKLYALKCGFKVEGINRKSFLKDGKYLDQIMVGITRGEACQA